MTNNGTPETTLEEAQAALLARWAPTTNVRRVRWSQGTTQVLELGDGEPLLLVHGGLGNAFERVPILPELAESRRVIAVDRPGHGLADPFDYARVDLMDVGWTFIRDIVDALGLNRADLVANSMGAFMSIAFALDAPERVSRLVLVGAPFGMKRSVPLPLLMLGLPLVGQLIGRLAMSKPTREGNRKFWGQILVAHPRTDRRDPARCRRRESAAEPRQPSQPDPLRRRLPWHTAPVRAR